MRKNITVLTTALIASTFLTELIYAQEYDKTINSSENIYYSIQLGSFKFLENAKAFIERLPANLKEKAFIYVDKDFYTVRIFLSPSKKDLIDKEEILKKNGFKDYIIVKTDSKKLNISNIKTAINETKLEKSPDSNVEKYTSETNKTYYFETTGKGDTEPKVPNRNYGYPGTPENRRSEIKALAFSIMKDGKVVDLKDALDEGLYSAKLEFSHIYPTEKIKDVRIYLKLPEEANLVQGSAYINGENVSAKKENGFIVLSKDELEGNKPLKVELKFLIKKPIKINDIPYAILFKTDKDKPINIASDNNILNEITAIKKEEKELPKPEINTKAKFGIIYPDTDIVQPEESSDFIISVPLNSKYSVLLNGEEIPQKYLAEKATDKKLDVLTLKYIGVPLKKGKNILTLKFPDKEEKREITVSGEVADLRFKVFPNEPPADGHSSAYVEILTVDKNGNPAKVNTYITVFVDKGDIYDYRTGEFKKFTNDGFKVKAIGGKAVIRLSPATKPEERKIKVIFGEIEREFNVRYYQEKRPWIVVGELEGGIGFSNTHNNPSNITDMPFDHSKDGTNFKGRGAVFAKGNVKDYSVTFRYDTRKPDDILLQQNIPSTEEGQFYPVYGDESEQYFEAQSKRKLYLRIDKDLSYFLYGDYKTDFGNEFDFNRYSRTFNGILTNIEKEKNFRIKSFISENKQDIVKEEFKGKGISGPYFIKNIPLQYSEQVWIEIRDRYNPSIVLDRRQLNRFTDYEINYEEGFIILKEPLPEFDSNLNPEFLVVKYETDALNKNQYLYGIRGEKWFKDIRIGSFFVNEEHPVHNKQLYGADIYYYKDGLKFISEWSHSKGFENENLDSTQGNAFRTELSYNNKNFNGKIFYKSVTDGFQNPSSMTAEEKYTNYGFNLLWDFKTFKITGSGLVDNRNSIDRKTVDLLLNKKLSDKLSIDMGTRWNQEEKENGTGNDLQAIAGVQFQPTEKLTLNLRREQSLEGKKESSYFPTRTVFRANYKWSQKTETFVQAEEREAPEKTQLLGTFGINSNIRENTTAFSKYTIDDSTSGWRSQSHIGLNHVFKWRDNFAIDVGAENVHTLSGNSDNKDYTALRLRGVYTQSEKYKLSGDYEIRFGNVKTEYILNVGGIFKYGQDYTILVRDRLFRSDYNENDLLLGIAKRPVGWDKLNYLLKLRWKISDRDETTNKYIFSYHLNYQPTKPFTLMGEYAAKYVNVKNIGHSFTDLIRGRILYDVTDRIDLGIHAGILREHTTKTYTFSWGPEVGFRLFENFWISVGYNFNGFHDGDFDDANYWSKGFYIKFRLKFDENSLKKLRSLGEERD